MAIKKFPLTIDGKSVRSLQELKAHFKIDDVLKHYLDGTLKRWLKGRGYETEAAAVEALDRNDAELAVKLGGVFGVEVKESVEIKSFEADARLERLRQYTLDPKIIERINARDKKLAERLAFNQEELDKRVDEQPTIYLVGSGPFTIPLDRKNKKFIGITLDEDGVLVSIPKSKRVSFKRLGLEFENIRFDENVRQSDAELDEWYYRILDESTFEFNVPDELKIDEHIHGANRNELNEMFVLALCYNDLFDRTGNDEPKRNALYWYRTTWEKIERLKLRRSTPSELKGRLEQVRQYTDDPNILRLIDEGDETFANQIVFNQAELDERARTQSTIYLIDTRLGAHLGGGNASAFTIPIARKCKKYIGVTRDKGGVPVKLSRVHADLKSLDIEFKNVRVVDNNQPSISLPRSSSPATQPKPSPKPDTRLERVRQYTDDPNIIRLIDTGNKAFAAQLAFTQDELYERARNQTTIYLVGNGPFTIPLDRRNRKYIGITRARDGVPVSLSHANANLKSRNIELENIRIVGSNQAPRQLDDRLERVRQYTDDPNILRLIDTGNQAFAAQLAFNQDELYERARDQTTICLVGNGPFTIPLDRRNRKYIGITRARDGVPVSLSRANADLKNLSIELKNIRIVGSNQPSYAPPRSPSPATQPKPSRQLDDRLERVRQYTDDPNILRLIDAGDQIFAARLAFTQDELYERARDQTTIYLIGNGPFTIPLTRWNRKYIGIIKDKGGVPVRFPTSKPVDFNALGLEFENIRVVGNDQPSSAPSPDQSLYGVPTTVDELRRRTGITRNIPKDIELSSYMNSNKSADMFMVCAFYLRRYEQTHDVEDLKSAAYWFKQIGFDGNDQPSSAPSPDQSLYGVPTTVGELRRRTGYSTGFKFQIFDGDIDIQPYLRGGSPKDFFMVCAFYLRRYEQTRDAEDLKSAAYWFKRIR